MISLSLGNRKEELQLLLSRYIFENSIPPLLSKNKLFFKTNEIKFFIGKTPSFYHNLMRKLLAVHISCFIKW